MKRSESLTQKVVRKVWIVFELDKNDGFFMALWTEVVGHGGKLDVFWKLKSSMWAQVKKSKMRLKHG